MGISARSKHRPKGWSPERRARQAALIRGWQPWRRSTGPKTEAGKARCSMNALKHGRRGRAYLHDARRVHYVLRLATLNTEVVRRFIRMRNAPPDLKPAYAMLLSAATDRLAQFCERHAAEKIQKSNEQTDANGKYPMQTISYERAAERSPRSRRSRGTSLSGPERSLVLRSPKRVGRRLVTPEPRAAKAERGGPP